MISIQHEYTKHEDHTGGLACANDCGATQYQDGNGKPSHTAPTGVDPQGECPGAPAVRQPHVGDAVVYHDSLNRPHNALLNAVHGRSTKDYQPCVNLTYVSGDPSRKDGYGRQIERASSAVHKSSQGAAGQYWRFPDEEAHEYKPPVES